MPLKIAKKFIKKKIFFKVFAQQRALANRAAVAAAAAQGLDEYQLQQLRHSLPLFHSQMMPLGANLSNLIPQLSNGRKREHDEELKPDIYSKVPRGKFFF